MGTTIEYIDGKRVEVTIGPLGEEFEEMMKKGVLEGLDGDVLLKTVYEAFLKDCEKSKGKKI